MPPGIASNGNVAYEALAAPRRRSATRMIPRIHEKPSPNHDERPKGGRIDTLILHYTGMKTARDAIDRLCDREAAVSPVT